MDTETVSFNNAIWYSSRHTYSSFTCVFYLVFPLYLTAYLKSNPGPNHTWKFIYLTVGGSVCHSLFSTISHFIPSIDIGASALSPLSLSLFSNFELNFFHCFLSVFIPTDSHLTLTDVCNTLSKRMKGKRFRLWTLYIYIEEQLEFAL